MVTLLTKEKCSKLVKTLKNLIRKSICVVFRFNLFMLSSLYLVMEYMWSFAANDRECYLWNL